MDWSTHFPEHFKPPPDGQGGSIPISGRRVEFADIGCGFGGLLVALAPMFPESLMLGKLLE